ncbi:MAG: PAS domain-containing protein [Propionibacteriaceae bacterium]|nr:PAS domain-containing protein [Propionibacteriaceae bacterium]
MFFSTTDRLGVITAANAVFVQLSRFGYRQLMGAPHNIIRHPAMPGGAFKLMWDTLEAGQPFCAYVDNLAADGSTYSVLATITPLGADQYLSVRCRPQCVDLRHAATTIYGSARPLELATRANGISARNAATIGLARLSQLLGDAGFATYEDFMNVVLPSEMAIRLSSPQPRRPNASGPAALLLEATNTLADALQDWLSRQSRLAAVAQNLQLAIPQLKQSMDGALSTGRMLTQSGPNTFDPLMIWIDLWAQMMPSVENVLNHLTRLLADLRQSCLRTVFQLALTTLHTQAVAQFAVELIDGVTVPDYDQNARIAAINVLARALSDGYASTERRVASNSSMAADTATNVTFAHDLLDVPRQVIVHWSQVADTASSGTAAMLPKVIEQVRQTDDSLALLDDLSHQISAIAQETPATRVNQALHQVLQRMADLSGQPSPSWTPQGTRYAVNV